MCISPSRPRRGQIFITQTHTKQNDLSEVAQQKNSAANCATAELIISVLLILFKVEPWICFFAGKSLRRARRQFELKFKRKRLELERRKLLGLKILIFSTFGL